MRRIIAPITAVIPSLVLSLACVACATDASAADPQAWVKDNLPDLIQLYRHFHQTPELSFQEEKTAARLAEELKAVGAEVTAGVGGHGVVALLKNGDGPTVMFRTDLDALPVEEKTNLAYASKVRVKNEKGVDVGVMHACGHDVHITNLIGTARFLARHKDAWKGTVMFIGQPAEERGAGARAMLKDGLFTKFPKPDLAIALHVDSGLGTGKVGYRAGYAFANVDSVDVTMLGRGGHGSAPQSTIDPIVIAARFVVDLQSIVAREIDPQAPGVITVGSIHGGTKHNIIGDRCHMQLTVRSYSEQVRRKLLSAIKRKAEAAAASAAAPDPIVKISEGTPSLLNDAKLVGRVTPVFRDALGKDNVVQSAPTMGGEDFSRYGLAGVPIFMFRLGSVQQKRLDRFKELGLPSPSLHSPVYYPDVQETLQTGVTVSSLAVMKLLAP
ncbi:MAG: amidohydrolase [Planctomycetales bacterium]